MCHGNDPAQKELSVDKGTTGPVISAMHSYVNSATAGKLAAYISSTLSNTAQANPVEEGMQLYTEDCAGCHGSDLTQKRFSIDKGKTGPIISAKHGYVDSASAEKLAAYINSVLSTTGQ